VPINAIVRFFSAQLPQLASRPGRNGLTVPDRLAR
jgi:hypothetical protein